MATLLCHIEIHSGRELEFEAVMKEMYRRTHDEEPNCVRYEYYRGAKPGKYYSLLSFTDSGAFWEHQVSDYHEGFDFAGMIKSLDKEWVDRVAEAIPLRGTVDIEHADTASDLIKSAEQTYRIEVQSWWQKYR